MRIIDFDGQPSFYGHPHDNKLLVESPDYIFINNIAHTKDTLSPVFGMKTQFASTLTMLTTDNFIGSKYKWSNNSASRTDSAPWYYNHLNNTYSVKNNMQADMCGIHASEIWHSTYEPDYYYHYGVYSSNNGWMYKIHRKTGQIVQRKNFAGNIERTTFGREIHKTQRHSFRLKLQDCIFHFASLFVSPKKSQIMISHLMRMYFLRD